MTKKFVGIQRKRIRFVEVIMIINMMMIIKT